MEYIKKSFAKVLKKFLRKKDFFSRVITRWQNKGFTDIYKKYYDLLQEAEGLSQELRQSLVVISEGMQDASTLKLKVKRFKEVYKELNEATKPLWQQWIEAIIIALILALLLRHTIFSPYHVPTGSAEPNILVGDRIWGNKMAYYFGDVKRGDLVIFDDPRHVYDENILQYLWQRYVGFPVPLLGLKTGPINVVKRVIGLPGDTIEGRIEDGKTVLYLNNKKLDEPYVNPYPLISLKKNVGIINLDSIGPLKVPDFLKSTNKTVRYTYVPSLPYSEQPYYNIKATDVIKNKLTGLPYLDKAHTPVYVMKISQDEYYSVDNFGPIKLPEGMYWVMGDSRKNSEDSRYWGALPSKFIRGRASFILFSIDSEEVFWLFDWLKHPITFWLKNVRWDRCFKVLGK